MTEPKNKQLYSKVKAEADEVFKKPSAYKSGWIVREYKKRGGKYLGSKKKDGLTRWFKEEWDDIGGKDYPVYRPTKRITKDTPLTASEIDPKQARKQIALKQVIKGDKNLPKFQKKIGGYSIMSDDIDYDKLKWGSFTKQFNAQKKKLGVKDLGEFADHIISNPAKFAKKTLQRANFYKNVIKGGAEKRKREDDEEDDPEIMEINNPDGRYAERLERRERIAERRARQHAEVEEVLQNARNRLPTDLLRYIYPYTRPDTPTSQPIRQQTLEEVDRERREKRKKEKKSTIADNVPTFGNPFGNNPPPPPPPAGSALFGSGYDAGAYPEKDPDDVYADIQGGSLIPTDGFYNYPHSSRFLPMYM